MSDLVAWLREQLDEDERVARQLIASPGGFYVEAETDDTDLMAVGGHVYRWSPKRVLAEVDAKRRILDEHGLMDREVSWDADENEPGAMQVAPPGRPWEGMDDLTVCVCCVPKRSHWPSRADVPTGPCLTVRLLALPYADREGYRDEWRVTA